MSMFTEFDSASFWLTAAICLRIQPISVCSDVIVSEGCCNGSQLPKFACGLCVSTVFVQAQDTCLAVVFLSLVVLPQGGGG